SSYGKTYTPSPGTVDANIDMHKAPRDQVNELSAQAYFDTMAKLMKDNPPTAQDAPIVKRMAKIGLVPGKPFDPSKPDPTTAKALENVPSVGLYTIKAHFTKSGKDTNGWQFTTQTGIYGTNYLQRAFVTYFGLGANRPEDAVYPT